MEVEPERASQRQPSTRWLDRLAALVLAAVLFGAAWHAYENLVVEGQGLTGRAVLDIGLFGVIFPSFALFVLLWLRRSLVAQSQGQAHLERRNRQLEALQAVRERILARLDPAAVAETALDSIIELLDADAAEVWELDPDTEEMTLLSHRGLYPEAFAEQIRFSAGQGFPGLVLQSGKPVSSGDLAGDARFLRRDVVSAGIRSYHCHPLRWAGRVVGALGVAYRAPYRLSADETRLLEMMAGLIGSVLENARLLAQAQLRAERIGMLSQVAHGLTSTLEIEEVFAAIEQQLRRLIPFERAMLALLDPSGERLRLSRLTTRLEEAEAVELEVTMEESFLGPLIREGRPELIADYSQPRQCRVVRHIREVGIRSGIVVPLVSQSRPLGALLVGSVETNAFSAADLDIVSELGAQVSVAVDNAQHYTRSEERREQLEAAAEVLRQRTAELETAQGALEEAYLGIGRTLELVLTARDPYLGGHSARDRDYARQVAQEMGLPREEVKKIEVAAELHDIGKLAVPDSILLKDSPLTTAEWAVMRRHPTTAVEMLRFLDFLKDTLPLIEGDHERWDGKGYPNGLVGEENPLGARILAVTDAYDAMTSDRPYRPALSHEQAVEELKKGAGSQFDPQVVEAFLRAFPTAPSP